MEGVKELFDKLWLMHLFIVCFVTNHGAFMTSTGTQNPSLTYMALTARAVDYAVAEMKKGDL